MKQKKDDIFKQKKAVKKDKDVNKQNITKKRKNLKQHSTEVKKHHKSKLKKRLFLLIILAIIAGTCVLLFKLYTFKTLVEEMFNNTPSTVFGTNKNVIAQIGYERNRDNVEYSKISNNLINAYISIEDQRYYTHHGVDIKRTGAAILSYIAHRGSSSFGGSTITQQLVKNLTGDDSNSISRKVKEWFYAFTLNTCFSKEDILEAYFNIIYTGPNIYGVQTASHYYFNKDIGELSLAECAFLAGLNNSPNSYNPFTDTDRTEKITNRTTAVLKKMLELNYISQEEYDLAILEVNNGLAFNKGEIASNTTIYSYHTDALINEIISDLAEKKHISKDFATNFFYLSGTNIYSTENNEIQEILENESEKGKYILKSSNGTDTSQAAMVVIDHSNGQVIACIRWTWSKDIF